MAHSTMMSILARESARNGRTLAWDDVFNGDLKLGPTEYAFVDLPLVKPAAPGGTALTREANEA